MKEADFLPGLTVDKYNDVLVVECLTLGMEKFKEDIIRLLRNAMAEDGIDINLVYERSDAKERDKEGLKRYKGVIWAKDEKLMSRKGINDYGQDTEAKEIIPKVEIVENSVHYIVDVVSGQKTGFFLDQKYNRLAMQRLCKGKKVLDCFTHMGTFALNAGIAGAKEVTGLDISEYAVSQATDNAKRNRLDDVVKFCAADVWTSFQS